MTSRVARWLLAAAAPLGALSFVLAALVAAPPAAWAHELGPFQVYGSFQLNGSFRLEIKIDEEHLTAAQLGGPARTTRYGRIAGLSGPAERQFGRFLSDLADSLTIAFDGGEVRPTLALDPDTGGGAPPTRATLVVDGWIPGGARAFTLKSSLPVKAYPLVLRCEGDESSIWKWVAGGEVSPPYALPARVVPPAPAALSRRGFELGFAGILPYGPTALLLLAAMFLLARRIPAALLLLAVFAGGQALGLALALRAAAPPRPGLLEPLLALAVACLAVVCLAMPMPRPRPRHWLLASILVIGALYGASLSPTFSSGFSGGRAQPPALPAAMAGFDLGIFSAGLVALAAAFALVGLPFRDRPWYRGRVVVPASCLIGLVGLYWSIAGLLP